jgi:hypothetical protein
MSIRFVTTSSKKELPGVKYNFPYFMESKHFHWPELSKEEVVGYFQNM